MATYYNNFSSDTVDQAPSGITRYWHNYGVLAVRAEDGVSGSKVVEETNDVYTSYIFYTIDSLADTYADAEILIKIKPWKYNIATTTFTSFGGVVLRGNNTTSQSSRTGYNSLIQFNYDGSARLLMGKWISGTWTQIGSAYDLISAGLTFELGKWFYIRFYVNGTSLKAKVWGMADTEPASWQIEETDSSITDPGYLGWVWRSLSDNIKTKHRVDYINVVTDGGTSPTISADEGTPGIYVPKSNIEFLAKDDSILTLQIRKTNIEVLTKVLSGNKPAPTIMIL